MPVLPADNYTPPIWLRNGHINTLYAYLFRRKIHHNYLRQRYITPDDDFFDVDWLKTKNNHRLAILLHGLEGSSSSQYIMGTTYALHQHGYDIAAINFRSCSGDMNTQAVMYHSGWTVDLHQFVSKENSHYDEIFIVGFSLGGNVTMKYCGDGLYPLDEKIKAVVGVSVPCDLKAGSQKIKTLENHLYEQKFIETLLRKIRIKYRQFPDLIDGSKIDDVKTLWDFDDFFTAPVHGFKNAEVYYNTCNSLQFLHNINIPALIVNALDDSFLPDSSYPYSQADANDCLYLMTPKYGGHVGFTTFKSPYYWIETVILDFCNKYSTYKKGIIYG